MSFLCYYICVSERYSGAFGSYTFAKEVLYMTQVDERLAKVGQNLKKFISESKYKTQVSFALDGMGQDPSVIRRWIKHGVNSLTTIMYIAEVLEIDFMELLK